MAIDWVRRHCLALPHTTETIQWGNDLVFKIGGKMYAVMALDPADHCLSFKCTPEDFAELVEREDIDPAPYLARASWVALRNEDALRPAELKDLLRQAYDLVLAKLPRKTLESIVGQDVILRPTGNRPKSAGSRARRTQNPSP